MEIIRVLLWLLYLCTVLTAIFNFTKILKNIKNCEEIELDIIEETVIEGCIIIVILLPIINIFLLFKFLFFYKSDKNE